MLHDRLAGDGRGEPFADEARDRLLQARGDRVGERVTDQVRLDEPEICDPGARPVRGQLGSQGAPERLDPRLAHRVRRRAHSVQEGVDRCDHDHVAAPLDDVRQCGTDGAPNAQEVDLDHAPERSGVHRAHRPRRRRDAGVGDDDVEGAEPLDDLVRRQLHGLGVGDIGVERQRALADGSRGRLRGLALQVEHGDARAASVERAARLEPDPLRRAGYEHHLAVEVEWEARGHAGIVRVRGACGVAFPRIRLG